MIHNGIPTQANQELLCYYYEYDGRKKMIEKKLPGADAVYLVYDNRDRLVLTQDGKLREDLGSSYYFFTMYDQLNRPVITGIFNNYYNDSLTSIRSSVGNYSGVILRDLSTDDGYDFNYSSWLSGFSPYKNLTYTYYDDYSFKSVVTGFSALGFNQVDNIDSYTDADGVNNGYFDNVKGLVTGSKTLVLDGTGSSWVLSSIYYDDRYRPIQTQATLFPTGNTMISTKYDFVGNILESIEKQNVDGDANSLRTIYQYDHMGRLLETYLYINQQNPVLLSQSVYNELGELQKKKIHSTDNNTFLQSVDYKYNIRGWLIGINDPDNLDFDNDYFGMELFYDNTDNNIGNSSIFNGNISAISWARPLPSTKVVNSYVYTYDDLNRITDANFKRNTEGTMSYPGYDTEYTYDLNGNIIDLIREDAYGLPADFLSYDYSGNMLIAVTDADYEPGLYEDRDISPYFVYDANGNMIMEQDKGLDIDYNYLNLPEKISTSSLSNNDKISYIYDANGTKWVKAYTNSSSLIKTMYAGGFVYEDTDGDEYDDYQIDYLLNSEGLVEIEGSTIDYQYFLKDHLGNTRVVFSGDGSAPIQKPDYYPFGMSFENTLGGDNKYLYNGKEMQDEQIGGISLDWYDYGARMYDPSLGRFHTQDRFAEKYFDLTPYQYAANNPILYIDVNGDSIVGNTAAVDNTEKQAKSGVAYEQKRQSNMQARAEKRAANGKSISGIERRTARSEFREGQYQSTVNEIGEMRASNNIYNINTSYVPGADGPDGYTEYAGTDAAGNHTININVSQTYLQNGGLAHELVHGYQFETGNMDFQFNGFPGLLYDISDEVSAYQRQFVFSNNSAMYNVTPSYVRAYSPANYGNLPGGHLNSNTSYFILMYHRGSYIEGGNRFIHTPYKSIGYPLIYNK